MRAAVPKHDKQAKLPLDVKEAEQYLAISRAFEARLSAVYANAPDDQQLPEMATQAANWNDEELLKEGRKLMDAAQVRGRDALPA